MPNLQPAQPGSSRLLHISRNRTLILFAGVCFGAPALWPHKADADPPIQQFWDGPNTEFDGIAHGGSGTWDNSATNFTNEAVSANQTWQGGVANFTGGPGIVTLGDNILFQGLRFNGDGYTVAGTGSFTLQPTGTADITTDLVVTATISAGISGAGGLNKTGPGQLILSGANTYTGGTTISESILSVASDTNLGDPNGGLVLNGGELLTTADATIARSVALTPRLTVPNILGAALNTTATYSGMISGSGGLTVGNGTDPGVVVLNNLTNNYTGGTTISNGATLSVASDANLGDSTIGITFDGGELLAIGNQFSSSRPILLKANNGVLAASGGDTAVFAGNITGDGSLTIGDALNTGIVRLAGTNTYLGATIIVEGATLLAGFSGALSPTSAFTVNGTLDVNGLSTQIGSLAGAGIVTNGDTQKAVLMVGDASSTLFSGVLKDGTHALGLNKVGSGTLTLTGTNTYSGGTLISDGMLSVDNNGELGFIRSGIGQITLQTGQITLQGGELLTTGAGFISFRSIRVLSVLGTDILAASGNTSALYAGKIFGDGLLQVGEGSNSGTVALSGNNTYTGGTNISGSTILNAESDHALGTGDVGLSEGTLFINSGVTLTNNVNFGNGETGTVINGGTLIGAMDDPNQNGFQDVVENGGTITGNITLGGSYSVVLNLGTISGNVILRAALSAALLEVGSKINGNLVIVGAGGPSGLYLGGSGQQSLSQAVTGSITNNGGLIKEDDGTWIIDRPLDAPLGTEIEEGTLIVESSLNTAQVDISQGAMLQLNAGGSVGNLDVEGSLIFAGSASVTVGSVISGPGEVIQDGTGTTILSGRNTYTGGTTISLGTLLVNNAQALGTGNVTVNRGVLGADPQPINVFGNYTQNAGGTLQLSIAGRTPGQFDVLNVAGTASLNGNLRLLNLGYQPVNGDKLKLVNAAGVVSGRFSALQNPFTLAVGFDTIALVYARNSVTLEFLELHTPVPPVPPQPPAPPIIISTTDYTSFALTFNQKAIGNALNAVQLTERDPALVDFLAGEAFANLPGDLDRLSPESLSAIDEISFSAANVQASNLEQRFADIRNGSNGFSSSLNLSNAPGTLVEGKDGKTIVESNKNILVPSPENKWGVWVSGNGDYINVSGDGNGHGYDFITGGVTFGLDYRLTPDLALGLAGSYAHTWTNLTGAGKIDANSGRAGLYATYFKGGFHLGSYIGGGYNSYSTRRAALGGIASGSSDSGEFDGYIGGGYEFHFGAFTFGPIASLQYTYVDVSGNDETGSLAPLRIQSKSQDSLRSNLGLSATYTTKIGKVMVSPSVRASWQHEYSYSALPVTAQFGGGVGEFTVYGPSEGQDSALVDAGVNIQWTPSIGTYFGYNGQLGRSNENSQGGTCSVHWDF
jgi:outer membrane autotransporter protein